MYNNTPELILRAKNGDKSAREEIIEQNLGLVHSIVKKFSGRGYDAEDLFQIGCIGIIKAADKFDLSYNVRFSTYAVPMIMGEIKRFLRDDGMIKVSRNLKEIAGKVSITREIMEKELGRAVSVGEIAQRIGESAENIVMAMDAAAPAESLYKSVHQGERGDIYLIDKLADEDGGENGLIDKIALRQLIEKLCERDRKIILLRYFKGKTQREISVILGISQVQVSRLEKKILNELRFKLKGA